MRTYEIVLANAPNSFTDKHLGFDKLMILCWIDDLVVNSQYRNVTDLAKDLGVSPALLYRVLKRSVTG